MFPYCNSDLYEEKLKCFKFSVFRNFHYSPQLSKSIAETFIIHILLSDMNFTFKSPELPIQ